VYIIKALECWGPLVMILIIVYEDLWFLDTWTKGPYDIYGWKLFVCNHLCTCN
jgi:hypothetical protein